MVYLKAHIAAVFEAFQVFAKKLLEDSLLKNYRIEVNVGRKAGKNDLLMNSHFNLIFEETLQNLQNIYIILKKDEEEEAKKCTKEEVSFDIPSIVQDNSIIPCLPSSTETVEPKIVTSGNANGLLYIPESNFKCTEMNSREDISQNVYSNANNLADGCLQVSEIKLQFCINKENSCSLEQDSLQELCRFQNCNSDKKLPEENSSYKHLCSMNIKKCKSDNRCEVNRNVNIAKAKQSCSSYLLAEKRKRTKLLPNKYSCKKCLCSFSTWRRCFIHAKKVHKIINIEDVNNERKSDSEDNTSLNKNVILPLYCCHTCSMACATFDNFQKHNCRVSDDSQSEPLSRILMSNIKKLHQMEKYICEFCGCKYHSFKRIAYHLLKCSPGPYSCELCLQFFVTIRELDNHKKRIHKGEKCFICNECGKAFERKTSLQKHIISWHESFHDHDFAKAAGGDNSCSDTSKDIQHINSGDLHKPCMNCNYRLFKCQFCPKRFVRKIYLTNHALRAHGLEKKFLCQICGNKFLSQNSLNGHLVSHKSKFECNFCKKQFKRKDNLQSHERIHTGEKPFVCSMCSKGFINKAKLDDHTRRHVGKQRYRCSFCIKSYAGSWDLKQHLKKVHNKECDKVICTVIPPQSEKNEERQENIESLQESKAQAQYGTVNSSSVSIPVITNNIQTNLSNINQLVQVSGAAVSIANPDGSATLHPVQTVHAVPTIHPFCTTEFTVQGVSVPSNQSYIFAQTYDVVGSGNLQYQ